jgi:hypothetical protein
MTKIVYNACHGGFGLSHKAIMRYAELKGITLYAGNEYAVDLNHDSTINTYTTVPYDEFLLIYEECRKKRNYARSNALMFRVRDIARTDPVLVQVVEELGDEASDKHAELEIVELPAGTRYRIKENGDGFETVETPDDLRWDIA